MRIFRQGDVLLTEISTLSAHTQPVPLENGRLVLAHGEVTGHAHVIVGDARLFAPADVEELSERFLCVERESQLVHDEHDTIIIPAGNYRVRRQREYTPEAIQTVAD